MTSPLFQTRIMPRQFWFTRALRLPSTNTGSEFLKALISEHGRFFVMFWKEISRVIDWLREMKNKYLTVRYGIHILISRFGLFIFYTNTEKLFVYIDQFIYVPLPHSTDNPEWLSEWERRSINQFSHLSQAPLLRKYAPWQDGSPFKNLDPLAE